MLSRSMIAGFLFSLGFSQVESVDELFAYANNEMVQEEFRKAAELYEEILSKGYLHKNLYYNLGNAYYRMGYTGLAIWSYEKGLLLDPRDGDLKYNLAIANAGVRDRIQPPDTIFIVEWYRVVSASFSMGQWIWIGIGMFFFAALLFVFYRLLLPNSLVRVAIFLFAGVALIAHGIALEQYWNFLDKDEGIIVQSEVFAYSAPFDRSDLMLFKIHEGIKVEMIQSQSGWAEIILLDGKQGWIQTDGVRKL